jgi:hypothetical protein
LAESLAGRLSFTWADRSLPSSHYITGTLLIAIGVPFQSLLFINHLQKSDKLINPASGMREAGLIL